jgi:hypothetical protein
VPQLEGERARLELELERSARLAAERTAAELRERLEGHRLEGQGRSVYNQRSRREEEMEMVSVAGVRTDISPGRWVLFARLTSAPADRPICSDGVLVGVVGRLAGVGDGRVAFTSQLGPVRFCSFLVPPPVPSRTPARVLTNPA